MWKKIWKYGNNIFTFIKKIIMKNKHSKSFFVVALLLVSIAATSVPVQASVKIKPALSRLGPKSPTWFPKPWYQFW